MTNEANFLHCTLRGQSPQETEKKRFFLIFFLTERNIGDIRTLGYVLVIFYTLLTKKITSEKFEMAE